MNEVIFDVETKKFFDEIEEFDPSKLGVSIVSVYNRTVDDEGREIKGQMQSFWEKDFPKMWPIFEEADRIVGFNSINFDVPALFPYAPKGFEKLPHFDILVHVRQSHGKRASLDAIAKASLGETKNDSGENAIKYWNKGDAESLTKLKKYCEMDVAITRDIYDFGRKNGYLKFIDFWNEIHEVKVDFSYPRAENDSHGQESLF